MDMDPSTLKPLTIVLLGHTGVGKSASGNTILGREAFESRRSFKSVTTEVSRQNGQVGGWSICVVDTPEIQRNKDKIRPVCKELLKSTCPVLFLVVIKIDRFTDMEDRALEAALAVVGEKGRTRIILLFTGEDNLDKMTLEEFINEDPENPLPKKVKQFQNRYHLFNNRNGGTAQVQELLCRYEQYCSIHPGEAASSNPCGDKKKSESDKPPLRLVLLGLPGAGKSSSGNTILAKKLFQSGNDFDPVTLETQTQTAVVDGQQVTVVDTPGISPQKLSPKTLFQEIMLSIKEAYPGPHAFIIVVPFGRMSEADPLVFEMLPKMFGKDAPYFCMVLFTHADGLSPQRIEELIQHKAIDELLSKCNRRFCVFNNRRRHNRSQVHTLLDTVTSMVKENKGWYSPETFRSAQPLSLQISLKWEEFKQWFLQLLDKIYELFSCKGTKGDNNNCKSMINYIPIA